MSETAKPYYKYCLVPGCTNTTVNSVEKLFFNVPRDPGKRKVWTKAMKRDEKKYHKLSNKTSLWCCEDHFSLKEDMVNYWQWNLTKDVKRLQLKAGVVPHIFQCQKRNAKPPAERKWAKKKKHMDLINEALSATPVSSSSTSKCQKIFVDGVIEDAKVKDKGIQVEVNFRKHFRSKGTNTAIPFSSVSYTPIKICVNAGTCTSPEKVANIYRSDLSSETDSAFECSSESSADYSSENEECVSKQFKEHMIKGTVMCIEKEPKLFLGLPKRSFFLIKSLNEQASLPTNHIYIVLKKLRLNPPFSILAVDFGLTVSTTIGIFSKSLPLISKLMQELIVWPEEEKILPHLPIPFRIRYAKVVSIIDCMEIEIEKPHDSVQQALTWSNYYNCHTLKYLVSCTPDGLINYISDGYGGQSSDFVIVKDSGYLQKLIPGALVMVNRGFQNISTLLEQRGCTLVRPPSVSTYRVSTKAEVKEPKRIAALIPVRRLISRLQNFKLLAPHACVDNHLTPILDNAVIVACGIINMRER